jgi:phage terminase large subunit
MKYLIVLGWLLIFGSSGALEMGGKRPFEDFKHYSECNYTDEELNKKLLVWSDEKESFEEEYYYNTLIIHSTYLDNKFIDNDYYKVMQDLKETNEDEYNVYGLGQWGVFGGRFFGEFKKHIHVVEPFPFTVFILFVASDMIKFDS